MWKTAGYIKDDIHPFWGSSFMRRIPREIEKMNDSLGLELEYTVNQPRLIDGDLTKATQVVFVVKKRPWYMKEAYCLYSIYDDGILRGFIGRENNGEIKTIRELLWIKDLNRGLPVLYRWLQALMKASCDKV